MAEHNRRPEGPAGARRRAQAARGGIQHVLLRPAAAAAVGDAQPRRRAGQEMGPRLHPDRRGSLPVRHAAAPVPDVRRTCGIAACARARKGGRGPFAQPPPKVEAAEGEGRSSKIVHVTSFQDPMREMDKLHTLYDSLMDARARGGRRGGAVSPLRRAGQGPGRESARATGVPEVAFRVAMIDGKVNFTVRG